MAWPRKSPLNYPSFWQDSPFPFDLFRNRQCYPQSGRSKFNGGAMITRTPGKRFQRWQFSGRPFQYFASAFAGRFKIFLTKVPFFITKVAFVCHFLDFNRNRFARQLLNIQYDRLTNY
jgi:hypothetical protein